MRGYRVQICLGLFLACFLFILFKLYFHSSENYVSYVSTTNFDNLNLLTFGNVELTIVTEKLEILQYDLTRPVSREIDKIECIFMKNAKPPYHLCPHEAATDWLSGQVRTYFVWESNIQDMIKKFFEDNPESMFIDLGCNIGAHTLYTATLKENIQVLSVEPFPKNLIRVHKAAHLNNIQDRITLVMAALSNQRGRVSFHEMEGSIAENSIVRKGKYLEKGFTANTILFNDLTSLVKKKKAFMKIDIEGSECHIFNNADKFFNTVDVLYILMELEHTLKEGPCCVKNMLDFLYNRNYTPYKLPYTYSLNETPLNYSLWKEWNQHDVLFKKIY